MCSWSAAELGACSRVRRCCLSLQQLPGLLFLGTAYTGPTLIANGLHNLGFFRSDLMHSEAELLAHSTSLDHLGTSRRNIRIEA